MTYVKTVLKKESLLIPLLQSTTLSIPRIFLFPVKHIISGNSYMWMPEQ